MPYDPASEADYDNLAHAIFKLSSRVYKAPPGESLESAYAHHQHAKQVALVIKGFASTSVDSVDELLNAFDGQGIETCIFSYRGTDDLNYGTVESSVFPPLRLKELTGFITDFLEYFDQAECFYLVAHSLGGNILAQWLCNLDIGNSILSRSELRWVAVMGSPINANPVRVAVALQEAQADRSRRGRPSYDLLLELLDYNAGYPEMLDRCGLHVLIAKNDAIVPRQFVVLPERSALTAAQISNIVNGDEYVVNCGHLKLPTHEDTVRYINVATS